MTMPTKWTEQQLEAITASGKGIVVSAAAGSGKTAVLIERTVRILADEQSGIEADRLLAVTFTNAAAAQLRDKLTKALSQAIEENPDSSWLALQQTRLQTAKLMTINAFCLEMVRNNIHKLGLQDGLKILENEDVSVMKNECAEMALCKLYEQDKRGTVLLEKLSRSDETKKEILIKFYDFLRTQPFSEIYINKVREKLLSDEYKEQIKKTAILNAKNNLTQAIALSDEVVEIAHRIITGADFNAIIEKDKNIIDVLSNLIDSAKWDLIKQNVEAISFPSNKKSDIPKAYLGSVDEKNIELEISARALIAEKRKQIKELLTKDICENFECSDEEITADMKLTYDVFEVLVKLSSRMEELMTLAKAEKNGADFADVELMTVRLLAECSDGVIKRTELCEEAVRSKAYKMILIDEFQDTNDLQELIFKCISDTDDLSVLGKNVFVVGDVKQSIYAFRQANPKLFMNARKCANTEKYGDVLREIILSRNFRSRENIIDFTNFLFSHIMGEEIGEVSYDDNEKLFLGASYDDRKMDTELLLFKKNADEDSDDEAIDYRRYSAEHITIASRIRQMLDNGETVFENGQTRRCRAGDFCILTRNKSDNLRIANAFEDVGINVMCREINGYLRSEEIILAVNLLRIIDNPMNDMAMLSVMLSPIMLFSADDTAKLKIMDKSGKKLYQRILSVSKSDSDTELANKCTKAVELVTQLRFYASTMPLARFIEKMYDKTDFYAVSSVYGEPVRKYANLRLLITYAQGYDNNSSGGLSGFVRYLTKALDKGLEFAQAGRVVELDNAVNVMTMHKSKGLEFPFVFLCSTSRRFNAGDEREEMILDSECIGLRFIDEDMLCKYKPLLYNYLAEKKHISMLSEEMRLLYVAVTRTREKLFITLEEPDDSKDEDLTPAYINCIAKDNRIDSSIVVQAKCMKDWLLMALSFHKVSESLFDRLRIFSNVEATDESCVIGINSVVAKACKKSNENVISDEKVDEKLCDVISKQLSYGYESKELNENAKVTVSEIAKHDNEFRFFPQFPKFSEEMGKLSAAKRGTLTHRFMELCDFEKAKLSVDDEIERLINNGKISEADSLGIYRDAVKKFFSGEFSNRISQAECVMREQKFLVKFADMKLDTEDLKMYNTGEGMLQGIADLIIGESDGYVLVDYKTDRVELVSELVDNYKLQLELYKAAFDVILDKPVKSCYIYSFWLSEGVNIDL